MDIVTLDRMLVIAGFLGILLILWAAAQKYRGPLSQKIKTDSPMDVKQVLSLGGDTRAILMQVEGQRVLVVTGRKSGTSVVALADATAPEATA
ncbi:MAG: hypothetical protein ABF308_00075 [Phaeobacter gallaeciensis]